VNVNPWRLNVVVGLSVGRSGGLLVAARTHREFRRNKLTCIAAVRDDDQAGARDMIGNTAASERRDRYADRCSTVAPLTITVPSR